MIHCDAFFLKCAILAISVSACDCNLHYPVILLVTRNSRESKESFTVQPHIVNLVKSEPQTNPRLLRLRGGAVFDFFGKLCPCFSFCGGDVPANDDAGGDKKKRRVGRMAGSSDIKANIRKVYTVISDVEHYKDWGGNGLQSIKILESGHNHAVAEYVCGSFGFTFHFSVFWALSAPGSQ